MTDDFEQAVEAIRNKKGNTERERVYEIIGFVLMIGGALLAFISYLSLALKMRKFSY